MFGSALRSRGDRDGAVVTLRADTGTFNAEVDQAERNWRESVNSMSREALKLDLANDRLKRSLAETGAESARTKRATIGLKDAEEQATRATDRSTREYREQQRALGGLSRGALAGSGAFQGLGRSLAFASGTFLGGAGLIYGIRQTLKLSSNLNEQTTKTKVVFGESADEVIRFANDALGLASDQALETASSIGALLRPLGLIEADSAKVSVKLTKLGVDLSSFYNTSVQDALDAIRSGLVGESEPLRKYGVLLSETRVQQVAMTQSGKDNAKELTNQEKALARVAIIYKDTGLAAGDYQRTIKGTANQEREAAKNFRETEIAIGKTLQPSYQSLLRTVNDYLGNAENQKRIQKDVNEAVQAGAHVVRGFASVLSHLVAVGKPVVGMLGGIENAAKLAFGLWVVVRLRGIAAALGLVSTRALTTAASMNTLAVAETRAATAGAGLAAAGRGVGFGLPAIGAVAATVVAGTSLGGAGVEQTNGKIVRRGGKFYIQDGRGNESEISESAARRFAPELFRNSGIASAGRGSPLDSAAAQREAADRTKRAAGGGGTASTFTREQELALEQERAGRTTTQTDDLRVARAYVQLRRKQADALKKGTKERYEAELAYQQALSAADQILGQIHTETQRKKDESATKRKERADAAQARREGQLEIRRIKADGTKRLSDDIAVDTAYVRMYRARRDAAKKGSQERLQAEIDYQRALEQRRAHIAEAGKREQDAFDKITREQEKQAAKSAKKFGYERYGWGDRTASARDKADKKAAAAAAGGMTAGQWEDFFLGWKRTFQGSFEPNVFQQSVGPDGRTVRTPGSSPVRDVIVHNHFNAPPTQTMHREAVYARHAMRAAFDG